jgi:glycine hydroxymethyltransferase
MVAEHRSVLEQQDPEIYNAIINEERRLREKLQLIPSENYVSRAILEATGSVMTQKYAEGYPGRRYYHGCEWVDVAESIAIERLKKLYGAEHANVQPHSGTQANIAVYLAVLKPGDTVLGMDLNAGGHLTHGSPVNISGQLYRFVHYGVDPVTERLDYDAIADLAKREKPKMIVCGATAYPRIIDYAAFKQIADSVGAYLLADIAHLAGLIVGEVHPSPIPYADFVSSSTHKTLRGPRGGFVLCKRKYARALDRAVFPGTQGGPLEHIIAAKAVCFGEALQPEFKEYARRIVENARALAESLLEQGFHLVSGGTDNHLMLINFGPNGPRGREVADALDRAGITVNANTVPGETRTPMDPSGIRLGTPAITTRGFNAKECREIGRLIGQVIRNLGNEDEERQVRERVREMCAAVAGRATRELAVA